MNRVVRVVLKEEVDIDVHGINYNGFVLKIKTLEPSKTINEVLSKVSYNLIEDIEIENIKVEDLLSVLSGSFVNAIVLSVIAIVFITSGLLMFYKLKDKYTAVN